jgi:glycosyltransferase involved in cell wall biosynthesis
MQTSAATGRWRPATPDRLAIVVPVYNEEASVDEFYARVRGLGLSGDLIFVDNASTDGTVSRIERYPDAKLIRHARNEGYGASIRDGIEVSEAERIIIIDADLEYPPETLPVVLAALDEHAVVYASRFLDQRPAMPLLRRAGNRFITAMYNLLFRQRTTDFCTGLKGLRRSSLPLSTLRQNGFEHAIELGAMIALAGEQIYDIPVCYVPRSRGRSKMRHLPEVLKFVSYLVLYWLRCVILRRPLAGDEPGRASSVPSRDAAAEKQPRDIG